MTVRESIAAALREGVPLTVRDLSKRIGVSEKDVPEHLEHLRRSLRNRGEELVVEPAECLECGFSFANRQRTSRPGSCPRCRRRRISLPRFSIRGW